MKKIVVFTVSLWLTEQALSVKNSRQKQEMKQFFKERNEISTEEA